MQFEPLSLVVHRAVLNAPSGFKASQIAEQVGRPYRVMIAELLHDGTRKPDMDLLVPYLHATGSDEPLKHLARVTGTVFLAMLKEKECLTPSEVEELYSVPASTLATRRCRGGGPDYTQLADDGGKILYRHEDVKHWLANRHRRG